MILYARKLPAAAGAAIRAEREPEKVLADVAENYLSEADAEARFGVVIHGGSVDGAATKARRQAMSEERITVMLELSNEELADGPRATVCCPAGAG